MGVQIEAAFWGCLLRVGQALIEASPTLLCGLIVAGVFRHMLGAEKLRRLFGSNTWTGIPRAWVLGMLLPVCSLGVFPILGEMRRARISGGTILAFALAAPLFNPISFLYGLTLSQPVVIFSFMFMSLVIITIIGATWDRLVPQISVEPGDRDEPPTPENRRLLLVVGAAANEITGPSIGYLLVAMGGVALLSIVLPAGLLQQTMAHSDPWSPALMAAVAVPAYVSPIRAMMQLGLIFEHGNSVGAGLTLLILGAGTNLGTLIWIGCNHHWRAAAVWLVLIVGTVLPFAYLSERPLYSALREEPHTHAFDEFCAPFAASQGHNFPIAVREKLREAIDAHEFVSLCGLGTLIVSGVVLRAVRRPTWSRDAMPVAATVVAPTRTVWNRPLSPAFLAVAVLSGLVGLSIVACYLYYPPPEELFEEIRMVRGSALSSVLTGEPDVAIREIGRWDDLTRKLEVGVYLRTGRLAPQMHAAADELRETLEEVRDALLAGDRQRARDLLPEVQRLHTACRAVYLPTDAARDSGTAPRGAAG